MGVAEQKWNVFIFYSNLNENIFDIFSELTVAVVLGDLKGHRIVFCNVGGQLSKRFPAAASQADQQGAASGLPDYPKYY